MARSSTWTWICEYKQEGLGGRNRERQECFFLYGTKSIFFQTPQLKLKTSSVLRTTQCLLRTHILSSNPICGKKKRSPLLHQMKNSKNHALSNHLFAESSMRRGRFRESTLPTSSTTGIRSKAGRTTRGWSTSSARATAGKKPSRLTTLRSSTSFKLRTHHSNTTMRRKCGRSLRCVRW